MKKENGAVNVLLNKITTQIKKIIIRVSYRRKSIQDNVKNKNEGKKIKRTSPSYWVNFDQLNQGYGA